MKIYDYKDESRDVKGKVSSNLPVTFVDRKTERNHRVTTNAPGLKERSKSNHSQPRRSYADDWEKYLQTSTKR